MAEANGGQRAHRRVGTMVRDKYRIDAFIATGSMANVYAATHRNGSRVALKILHRELAQDPSMAERFKREGYFANSIGHPGVVRAIDDDLTEDGCAFIVMELLEGENLEERRVRLGGRIPLGQVLQIADAMLDVLAAAHDHEVLHRDMKPENVYITKKNEVKLLDFGVARFNDGRSSSDMTGIGMVLGTPSFMPPEQALGRREDVDARSDIWSVGATLFTVIAGQAVHAGGDAKTKLIATARTPARPLRDVVPEIPRAVASVIDRALAFERVERWADAKAMREALRWARLSIDGTPGAESLERPTLEPIPPPIPTQRGPDSEPTLAGRSKLDSYDDSTERRPGPTLGGGPAIRKRKTTESVDGVFTSAPPVTQRDVPPSMAMSEGPTFSLRNDPVFSLRRSPVPAAGQPPPPPAPPRPATKPPPPPPPVETVIVAKEEEGWDSPSPSPPKQEVHAPITQRLPTHDHVTPQRMEVTMERPKLESQPDASTMVKQQAPVAAVTPRKEGKNLAETVPGADAAEIFRAALAEAAGEGKWGTLQGIGRIQDIGDAPQEKADIATLPRFDGKHTAALPPTGGSSLAETLINNGPPRPAAGMPPEREEDHQQRPPSQRPEPPQVGYPTSPSIRTNPGIGPTARSGSGGQAATLVGQTTAAMPTAQPQLHHHPTQPLHSPPPPPSPMFAPPEQPPTFPAYAATVQAQYPQQQFVDEAAMASMRDASLRQSNPPPPYTPRSNPPPPDHIAGRPSLTPDAPGPLLATIAPKKRSSFVRIFIPIMIGVLAGVATYVVVVRQRAANASHPVPAPATQPSAVTSASASASASSSAPIASASSSSSSAPIASASAPAASGSHGHGAAAPSASVAAANPPPKKLRPRRPKPPATPSTAATPTTTTQPTAEPAPTSEPAPTPAPAPAPAPTPQDSLPRKEDN